MERFDGLGTCCTLFCLAFFSLGGNANAMDKNCTIIAELKTGEVLYQSGDCETPRGAQSTFKIPLALMGFDRGILKDAHNPTWTYQEGYTYNRPIDKEPTDPAQWEKESVVWFSQKLTRQMGAEIFKKYVDQFDYGNKDISGDTGKNNGLTHAWLSSSLQISPAGQTTFLHKLHARELGVTQTAYEKTMAIIPVFESGGWQVHGKTGTGYQRGEDGAINRDLQEGWFVGWATKQDRQIVFAQFIADRQKEASYAGPRARDKFLEDLPRITD